MEFKSLSTVSLLPLRRQVNYLHKRIDPLFRHRNPDSLSPVLPLNAYQSDISYPFLGEDNHQARCVS